MCQCQGSFLATGERGAKTMNEIDMSEKPIVLVENCQLEFQRHRGVLYVHGPEGATILRVCQIPSDENVLDEDGRATRLVDVADRRGWRFG